MLLRHKDRPGSRVAAAGGSGAYVLLSAMFSHEIARAMNVARRIDIQNLYSALPPGQPLQLLCEDH